MNITLACRILVIAFLGWRIAHAIHADEVTLRSTELNESSGVAQVGDYVWSHNDSGDKPRLFVFRTDGELLAEINVRGAEAIDWEDMCSFVRDGRQYVAVGDVGDNAHNRSFVSIYVIEVPAGLLTKQAFQRLTLPVVATIRVTYPDHAVDCEALAYDPLTHAFVLASKEALRCRLFYTRAIPLQGEHRVVAELTNTFLLPLVTGGDISADGRHMALCTYGPGCRIERAVDTEGQPWQTAGEDALKMFDLPTRKQGESICFSRDGRSVYLTSEHLPTPLFTYPLPQP